ncbi:glycosyl hydrolase family 95 catalytic domain-containing protein [Bacteroides fragilis]|uniref:glycosyl hydrolase family 95 catalytic domain-containing protein n=1 Tax=Bacteroides fragilis TaxID=817 RepID=UPI001C7095E4|nr:DUF5703 domain-containing protein [Bacteroides fragilis]MBW9279964.1 hypothetical protein [Bacteroides fragilis]
MEPEFDGFNGFPLGNGDLGGMLWFTDEGITLQLNKVDLYDKPVNGRMTLRSAGRVKVNLGVPCYSYMHLADFKACLSLQNADLKIKSSTAFADTEIASWIDANSNVWVIDCQADYKNSLPCGAINRISLERWGSRDFGGWYGARDRDVASGIGTAKVNRKGNDIILEEKFEGGLCFTVACRVLEAPTEIQRVSDRENSMIIPLSSKQKYKILISVASSNDSDHPTQEAISLLDKAEAKTITVLQKEHARWWSKFWSKSFVHLSDNYLENIYYIRRYLMGSSSRGKYPVPFNGGLWTTNYDHRQWTTPHHWNTQESYWGLAVQNDCELLRPYIETYDNMIPQGEQLAKKKGTKGGLLITEAHDFSGDMVSANWGNMTTNYTPASQISKIMWEYYAYTQDIEYLKTKIYPFMKEAAEFYLDFLQWDDTQKEFYIYPAQPYEHEWSSKLKNTITDRYMIESLFKNCIKAAQDLHVDKLKIKQWKHVLSHLWAPPILDIPEKGKVFGLAFAENNEVYPDVKLNIQGYHFDAHTTAVFPAGVLGLDHKGSDYFEIARNIALQHPQNRNAITPGAIVSARLGLGDKVLERLRCSVNYLQHFNQGLFYNLDHWHYFSRYVEQVPNAELYTQRDYIYDSRLTYNRSEAGKSGYRTKPFVQCGMETMGIVGTAINEMLLQSHEGKIRVFPAMPSNFSAAFTLRAEGAFIVSSVVDSLMTIPFVEIESLAGKECRIQNPWGDHLVQVMSQSNLNVNVKVNKDHVISFKTTVGESYIIKKKDVNVLHIPETYHATRNMFPKKYGEAMLGKERTF